MLNFLKNKQTNASKATFRVSGMHCTSCAINIDGALEDTAGVLSATTSYAKGKVVVEYDPEQIGTSKIIEVIANEGYQVKIL